MFTLPDLPYSFNSLEPHLDALTMEIHHDKHHAAYVTNLNSALSGLPAYAEKDESSLEDILKNLTKLPEDIRTQVRNHGGGHFNHSLFWRSMSPKPPSPSPALLAKLTAGFGSFDSFKDRLTKSALSCFGSGWAWLVVQAGQLKIISTPNQDSPVSAGDTPVLGVDVWEHAYYLKYQNRRSDYLAAWWNVVNWSEVEKRLGS